MVDSHPTACCFRDVAAGRQYREPGAAGRECAGNLRCPRVPGSVATWARSIAASPVIGELRLIRRPQIKRGYPEQGKIWIPGFEFHISLFSGVGLHGKLARSRQILS